jgi:hypothetical protein
LSLSRTTSLTDSYNIKNIFFVILYPYKQVIIIHFAVIYMISDGATIAIGCYNFIRAANVLV